MRFAKWMGLTSISVILSGCATVGNYCDVARPIRPSVQDVMTDETKAQIVTENEKLAAFCGVKAGR